jgi:hypothetical protein
MRRHLGIGSVDLRLVETCLDDGDLGIVRNDKARNAANRCKGARVGADPIAEGLRPGRLRVVKFEAPITATKICAWRTSPVSRSTITGMVSPA